MSMNRILGAIMAYRREVDAGDLSWSEATLRTRLEPIVAETEREAAIAWRPDCEYLSSLISDRVQDMERLLTDKLAKLEVT